MKDTHRLFREGQARSASPNGNEGGGQAGSEELVGRKCAFSLLLFSRNLLTMLPSPPCSYLFRPSSPARPPISLASRQSYDPSSPLSLLTRELHHNRRLRHLHLLTLYELLATESSIYRVTELCAGGELFDYLVEHGRLSLSESRRIFGQLCLASFIETSSSRTSCWMRTLTSRSRIWALRGRRRKGGGWRRGSERSVIPLLRFYEEGNTSEKVCSPVLLLFPFPLED
jgi:hypothetical protein